MDPTDRVGARPVPRRRSPAARDGDHRSRRQRALRRKSGLHLPNDPVEVHLCTPGSVDKLFIPVTSRAERTGIRPRCFSAWPAWTGQRRRRRAPDPGPRGVTVGGRRCGRRRRLHGRDRRRRRRAGLELRRRRADRGQRCPAAVTASAPAVATDDERGGSAVCSSRESQADTTSTDITAINTVDLAPRARGGTHGTSCRRSST